MDELKMSLLIKLINLMQFIPVWEVQLFIEWHHRLAEQLISLTYKLDLVQNGKAVPFD